MSLNYKDVLRDLQAEQLCKVMELCGHKIRPWGRVLLKILPIEDWGGFHFHDKSPKGGIIYLAYGSLDEDERMAKEGRC